MKEPDMIAINEKQAAALETLGINVDITYAIPRALADAVKSILDSSPSPRRKRTVNRGATIEFAARTSMAPEKFTDGGYTRAAADSLMVLHEGRVYSRDAIKKVIGTTVIAKRPWLINALLREGFLKAHANKDA